jgi:hypothetical protein
MTEKEKASHPGRQRRLRKARGKTAFYYGGIVLSLILLFHSIFIKNIKDNTFMGWRIPPELSFKILDTPEAVALLVGLIGIPVLIRQFSWGLQPYISYQSDPTAIAITNIGDIEGNTTFWSVKINNAGNGLAIVEDVRYRVCFIGEKLAENYNLSYSEAIDKLAEKNLLVGIDFSLGAFSNGTTIPPASSFWIFELANPEESLLKAVDIRIQFDSLLDDKFQKEIFCVPRGGFKEFFK